MWRGIQERYERPVWGVFFKLAIELIQNVCLLLILHSTVGWCLVTVDVFHTFPH